MMAGEFIAALGSLGEELKQDRDEHFDQSKSGRALSVHLSDPQRWMYQYTRDLGCVGALVAAPAQLDAGQGIEVACEVGAPVAQADDSDSDRRRMFVAPVAGGRHAVAFPDSA